jgi:3-hydroxyisobutyrate dehydrogenase-like beta-hydroxyacid dehydrogenase
MKVAFVGLGKLGFPCSQVCVEKGHDVTGYDPVITKNNLQYQHLMILCTVESNQLVI